MPLWDGWRGRTWISGVLAVAAVSLQGCQWAIPRHNVPNWELQPSYLRAYDFSPPGSHAVQLNSCEDSSVPVTIKCSGHGHCVEWFDTLPSFAFNVSEHRLSFCECDQDWADPECRTERKSQLTAFLLSIFLGMFGADQFYLGFIWPLGILKLITLGGLGIWWIYDIVRIGSSPVPTASQFRVAHNVHHWAFVLTVLCFTAFLGFALSIWSINHHRWQKARDLILLRSSGPRGATPHKRRGLGSFTAAPTYGTASPGFSGYATTLSGMAA